MAHGEKNSIVYRTENQELAERADSTKLYPIASGVSPESPFRFFPVCAVINPFVFSGALCPSHVVELLPGDYWT